MATKMAKKPAAKAAKKTIAKAGLVKTTKAGLVKTDKAALVNKLAYFILYVPDMTKAINFYKSIGLTPSFESPEWSQFDAGINFALHGMCADSCQGEYKPVDTSLSFGVTSAKATYNTFKAMGIKLSGEPHQVCEEGYAFGFEDIFGNKLNVYGPL